MKVRRIYGALNVEFENRKCVNFAILDRECDKCTSREGGCTGCEEVEKPWNEYYQLLEYSLEKYGEEGVYVWDRTEALEKLVDILSGMLKEEKKQCLTE